MSRLAALLLLASGFTVLAFGQNQVGPNQVVQDQEDRRDLIYYPGDTEHAVPLARKLASNVLLDQKAIWTSPFHMDKEDAIEWAGFGVLTATLIVTDRRTSHLLENSPTQVTWSNNVSKAGAAYTVLPVMSGFYLYGVFADNEKARETGVLGGEALLDGLIVSELLKVAARRNRPNAPKQPGDFFKGGASFPSGHATASFAMASVVAHEYRNRKFVPFVAYGLAALVSAARIGAQQHYASDVVAGGAIGYFIGRYVVNTHEAHAEHHHGILTPSSITPLVQPSTRTFGLAASFGN
jgi:membrane-associated phospholipid phosphatase